jgi:hypothetical protein
MLPMTAQATPHAITCQVAIPLDRGASLTYELTGRLPENTRELPQNLPGTILTLTVQWRDRNGDVQTLLNGTPIHDYEAIAPDADYSQLPFK